MKRGSSSKACERAGDTLTLGATDDIQQRQAEFHLKNCDRCQEDEQIVDGLRQTVLAADDRLDDLTRARVQGRLAEAMEQAVEQATAEAPPWRGRAVKLAAVAAVAAVALAVVTAAILNWSDTGPVDAPRKRQAPVMAAATMVLQPRAIVEGSAPWPNSGLELGRKVSRLQVPAGVALQAALTRSAELTLYGPLDLTVERVAEGRVELRLARGILVGEYDGSAGGSLRIRSPRAVTDVVGTLFSVEAHDGQSRVSVSRGKVKVRGVGETVNLGARKSWSTRTSRIRPTPPSVSALFAKHDRQPEMATGDTVASREQREQPAGAELAPRLEGSTPAGAARREAAPEPRPRPRAVKAPPKTAANSAAPAVVAAEGADVQPAPAPGKPAKAPAKKPAGTRPGAASASALYRRAEAALGRRDVKKAELLLRGIVRSYPKDPMADAARYELALLLRKRGQGRQAEAVLGRIGQTRKDSRFRGPAHYLSCRIKQESGKRRGAMACYGAFKDAFPSSPHHRQALLALIRLSSAHKDCARIQGYIADYLALYPAAANLKEARRLGARCGK